MKDVALSQRVFAILSALVEERLGIHYGPEDIELFASKVGPRAQEAGFESALDYYYFLRYDDPLGVELEALTETLVVGETYFFREKEALEAAVVHVIQPAIQARGRARVLSAACSTGEEPIGLAVLLKERDLLASTEIVASDVSARALAKAREGRYGARAIRALPPAHLWWLERTGDSAIVDEGIRRHIEWHKANLLDDEAMATLGAFDLILCRNVLIYFRDDTVHRVLRTLMRALVEGGRLLVGTSESLLRFGTALRCEERGGAFFYAKETGR
jgi:chemotaxis protein methyltransferase CheR